MTPQQFEESCGTNNHKYLENIQTDYGPLKTLTQSGMLKPHSRYCQMITSCFDNLIFSIEKLVEKNILDKYVHTNYIA